MQISLEFVSNWSKISTPIASLKNTFCIKIDLLESKCSSIKQFDKTKLSQKHLIQKNLGYKKYLFINYFGPKTLLVQKFWLQQFLGPERQMSPGQILHGQMSM